MYTIHTRGLVCTALICRSPEDAVWPECVLESDGDVRLVGEQSAVGQSIQRAELAIIRTGPFADIVS